MKNLFCTALIAAAASTTANADIIADWRLHSPFDTDVTKVIDTPDHVYFTSLCREYQPGIFGKTNPIAGLDRRLQSLFRYSKEDDEIISLNSYNLLSANIVDLAAYNYDKGYLLIVYADGNIDFLYDDGRVENCPSLKAASIAGVKKVNDITFDNEHDAVYIATSFGYIALNDVRHEVSESRNYGRNILTAARSGGVLLLADDYGVYASNPSAIRFTFDDYVQLEGVPRTIKIGPLDNQKFALLYDGDNFNRNNHKIKILSLGVGYTPQLTDVGETTVFDFHNTPSGFTAVGNIPYFFINKDASFKRYNHGVRENYNTVGGTCDDKTMWIGKNRLGLSSWDFRNNWTMTRDNMRPNAPATFLSSAVVYHPRYGMLAGSNGCDLASTIPAQRTPMNISALKDGFWSEFGTIYTNPEMADLGVNYSGLALDPADDRYVWRGSKLNGLLRINLDDPSDILHLGHSASSGKSIPGFVEFFPTVDDWKDACLVTEPTFDSNGTMWFSYARDLGSKGTKARNVLYYWSAQDRLASKDAASLRRPQSIALPVSYVPAQNSERTLAMRHANNANFVAVSGYEDGGSFLIYDHNGTPGSTSDDRYVHIVTTKDQDGGDVIFNCVNGLFEDPTTGLLWILSARGVFTINPATALNGDTHVNRIKVSRNDGTSLADYLLNEVNTDNMTIDPEGRKWFFTTEGGVVCTSADGKSVLQQFNTSNSRIPSDDVYTGCWNPATNSLMIATSEGLAEIYPSGSGNLGDSQEARIFPNPVEPDFHGYVRIDNIATGSLVKVADAKGNIVKELGKAEGGALTWDISGLDNTRVKTGVYYILVSPPDSGSGKSSVNKILVLN